MPIIYKTTNLINNKIYVGKSKYNRKSYLGSGKLLWKAFNKYGKENFKKEILASGNISPDDLNLLEKYWIKKLNSTDLSIGYNLTEGGDGGLILDAETRKRMGSNNYYGDDHWMRNPKYAESRKRVLEGRKSTQFGNVPCHNKGMTYEEHYGEERSKEIKKKIGAPKNYESRSGKGNIMYKRTIYDVWVEKHGVEWADKRMIQYKETQRVSQLKRWKKIKNEK